MLKKSTRIHKIKGKANMNNRKDDDKMKGRKRTARRERRKAKTERV